MHARWETKARQAILTSTSWMPAPDGVTTASPLPAADSARSVQDPGAAKNRKSPVADATTSAVNSSEESSSRTNAPPTAWPSRSTTRPVMTVSFSRSTLAGNVCPCFGAEHISASQLDRGPHQGAVFRPTAVVVLDVLMSEQLAQHEPGVRRPLTDPAIGDGLLRPVQAGVGVQLGQLFVGLEGAVLVGGFAPRHVDRAGNVTGPLALFLRQVCRRQDLAGKLVGGTDVDQVLDVDRGQNLVAECPDRVVGLLGAVGGGRTVHLLARQRAAVQLPLLAAAVEQLDLVVPVELEVPVGVGGEPVVVAAVEDHGVVVGDAAITQQLGELLGVDEVAADRVLQIGTPVQFDRAGDVAGVVGAGVLVDFDEDDARRVEIALGPV